MTQNKLLWTATKLLRAAAWLLIVATLALSLVPASQRPVTGTPHNFEHLAIFVVMGLVFGLGYRSHYLSQAAGLVAFAGAVEIAQYWVPGRHARISDFIVHAIGICISVVAAWLAIQAVNRRSSILAAESHKFGSSNEHTKYTPDAR
jgi:VanZ family protein